MIYISKNKHDDFLDEKGNLLLFKNKKEAYSFLRENGYEEFTDEQLESSFLFKTAIDLRPL